MRLHVFACSHITLMRNEVLRSSCELAVCVTRRQKQKHFHGILHVDCGTFPLREKLKVDESERAVTEACAPGCCQRSALTRMGTDKLPLDPPRTLSRSWSGSLHFSECQSGVFQPTSPGFHGLNQKRHDCSV
jgi:hypothetical protein